MNSNPTQCNRILDYMLTHGSITQFDAMRDLGVMRLGARIFELKERGHKIIDEMVEVKDRHGNKCHVKRYMMIGDGVHG